MLELDLIVFVVPCLKTMVYIYCCCKLALTFNKLHMNSWKYTELFKIAHFDNGTSHFDRF